MCKTNDKEIWPSKSGFAHKIHVSWLYYANIKIRDTFVYKHILVSAQPPFSLRNADGGEEKNCGDGAFIQVSRARVMLAPFLRGMDDDIHGE